MRDAIAANPPPMNNNRLPRVLFATQADTQPPTIVLFTTGFLDAGYRRYLERKFRESFGFHGTPVRIAVRSEEHTSELQSRGHLVCRLLLEKKKHTNPP